MYCATCENTLISPKVAPFGGFMCDNDHLQCSRCNQRSAGRCGVCETRTAFVEMNFSRPRYPCIGESMGDSQSEDDLPMILDSSEISFEGSTESLKKCCLGGTVQPPIQKNCTQEPDMAGQQEMVVKALQNFEGLYIADPQDSVESYLSGSGPLTASNIPAYSTNHNCDHRTPCEAQTPRQEKTLRSPPAIAVVDSGTTADHGDGPSEKPSQVVNAHRAMYQPFPHTAADSRSSRSVEPPPQFQLLTCSPSNPNERPPRRAAAKPIPASRLNISRSHLRCPESTCQRMILVSDFNRHMACDHMRLPIERISSGAHKNFSLDPRVVNLGVHKCIMLYFIRDRVTDLGSGIYKDCLPIMIMSTYIRLSDLCRVPQPADTSDDSIFLVVWLTGIVPPDMPLYTCLTVWPLSGQTPACHVVHSGKVYPLEDSQSVLDLCRGGQVLMLSDKELQQLTRGGKDMLNMQLLVQ